MVRQEAYRTVRPNPALVVGLAVASTVAFLGVVPGPALGAPSSDGASVRFVPFLSGPLLPTPAISSSPSTPSTLSPSVLATLLPNANGSLPGNFVASVQGWEVGTPAIDPATGALWIPELPVVSGGLPLPETAPVVRFDLASLTFQGVAPVLANASALAYDPANGLLYATLPEDGTVQAYDPVVGSTTGPAIPVGTDPTALVYDPPTGLLFVTNSGSDNITVINTTRGATGSVVYPSLPVGIGPSALVDDPADHWVFVANAGSSYLSVLSTLDPPTAVAPVTLAAPATGLAYDPGAGTVAVTMATNPTMALLNASGHYVLTSLIPVGTGAGPVAATPDGASFVVANVSNATLSEVNATTGVMVSGTLSVGPDPLWIAVDPASSHLVVWSNGSRTLDTVEASTLTLLSVSPNLGPHPVGIAFDPGLDELFVPDTTEPGLLVLNGSSGRSLVPPIPLAGPPMAVAVDPQQHVVYVGVDGAVEGFDEVSGALVVENANLTGPNAPMIVDPVTGTLWVGRAGAQDVVGLNATTLTVVATLGPIGVEASALASMAFDPGTSDVYVVNGSSGNLTVFNSSDLANGTWSVPAGSGVEALLYDPLDDLVYAAGDALLALNTTTFAFAGSPVALPAHVRVAGMAFDPSRGAVFVATDPGGATPATLTVLDGGSAPGPSEVTTAIPIGLGPSAVLALPPIPGAVAGRSVLAVPENVAGTVTLVGTSPSIRSFGFVPNATDVGLAAQASVVVDGGARSVEVSYAGLPPGCASADALTLLCTPNGSGTFEVVVQATDALGARVSSAATLVVNGSLAVSATFGSLPSAEADVGTSFSVSASAAGGIPPIQFLWAFGDGESATGPEASHVYTAPGSYLASVTVSDAAGASSTVREEVEVMPLPSAVLASAPGPATDVNAPLSLSALVSGGTTPGVASWTFGDGSPPVASLNVSHAWSTPGRYEVGFQYVDASGAEVSQTLTVHVNPALTGSFSVRAIPSPAGAVAGNAFDFLAELAGGTPPISIVWSFGDGSSATGASVEHVYGLERSLVVEVLATDAVGNQLSGSLAVTPGSSSASATLWSGGISGATFGFGVLLGGTVAALALFLADRSRRARPSAPPSPYVPPVGGQASRPSRRRT